MAKKRWVAKAIKRPGALRRKARAAGAITPKGTISRSWIQRKARGGGRTGRQARLAVTLGRMRRRKR